MKFSLFVFFFAAILAFALAQPVDEQPEEKSVPAVEDLEVEPLQAEKFNFQPRVTCDILGVLPTPWGTLNDAPCAAHCLIKGNRGGYCNSQRVCVCRN